MKVDLGKSQEYSIQEKISHSNPVHIEIIDRLEGDMNLTIMLINDPNSKGGTRFHAIDSFNAEIHIINRDTSKYIRPEIPILLGSYKRKNDLYLEYVLEPQMSDGQSLIRVKFTTKAR